MMAGGADCWEDAYIQGWGIDGGVGQRKRGV
jgi:hypothetical protein